MLEKIFGPYRDYSLFVLRLFVGAVFLAHGALKLFGGLSGFAGFLQQAGVPLPDIMAPLAAAVEFLGGVSIILGLGTRIASLLLTAVMVVAMVTVTLNGSHRLDRYGRVARDQEGRILAVFEPDELSGFDLSLARTVNPSLYCFERAWLESHIPSIKPVSKDGFEPEYHLPRLIPMAHDQGRKILEVPLQDETEALGVNTHSELLDVREILAARNHNHNGRRS